MYTSLQCDDMLDELNGARIFSKVDHKYGYQKIAFKTKHGLYE